MCTFFGAPDSRYSRFFFNNTRYHVRLSRWASLFMLECSQHVPDLSAKQQQRNDDQSTIDDRSAALTAMISSMQQHSGSSILLVTPAAASTAVDRSAATATAAVEASEASTRAVPTPFLRGAEFLFVYFADGKEELLISSSIDDPDKQSPADQHISRSAASATMTVD